MCSLSPFLFISSLSLLYNKNNKNIMQSHSLYCHRGGKESGLFQYVRKSYCPLLFISLPLTICLEVLSSYKYKSTKTHHWMKSKHSAFFVTYYSSVDKDSFKNKRVFYSLFSQAQRRLGEGRRKLLVSVQLLATGKVSRGHFITKIDHWNISMRKYAINAEKPKFSLTACSHNVST